MRLAVVLSLLTLSVCLFQTVDSRCEVSKKQLADALAIRDPIKRDVDINDINEKVQAANEAIDKVLNALNALSMGSLSEIVEPFEAVIGAFASIFKLISLFFPKQDSPELQYMKQQFKILNVKIDGLVTKVNAIPDEIALEFFKNDMLTFKKIINDIILSYNMYANSVTASFTPDSNATINLFLADLRCVCLDKNPQYALEDIYTDMLQHELPDTLVKGTDYTMSSIEYIANDLFNTLITFSTMHTACLGVKEGVTQSYIDLVNSYTTCVLDDFVTIFGQVESKLRNEFWLNDRLNGEINAFVIDQSQNYQSTAERIYQFFTTKYYFNAWLVHVYEDCYGYDHHEIFGIQSTAIGWGSLFHQANKNLVYSWTDASLPASSCPDSILKSNDYGYNDAQDCTNALQNAIGQSCGDGYANMIHYSRYMNGYFIYNSYSYALEKLSKWYGAVGSCRYPGYLKANTNRTKIVRPKETIRLETKAQL